MFALKGRSVPKVACGEACFDQMLGNPASLETDGAGVRSNCFGIIRAHLHLVFRLLVADHTGSTTFIHSIDIIDVIRAFLDRTEWVDRDALA